jgi:hypothetical protein
MVQQQAVAEQGIFQGLSTPQRSNSLSTLINEREVAPSQYAIADYQDSMMLSREFGAHFSSYLTRAKIIATPSVQQQSSQPQGVVGVSLEDHTLAKFS